MDDTRAIDFERLYSQSATRLYAFAYRMLGDRDSALDVVHEAFAIALAHAAEFRGDARPLTWLTSIARNLCLKRSSRVRELTFDDFEAAIGEHGRKPASLQSDIERTFYVAEVKEGCLIGLLACLPVNQRCVFVLHILNDLSVADVASIMEKSPAAVRVLLSRARSSMRRFLCRNCSLLGGSSCECAGMIDFSLARHLIERYSPGMEVTEIRDELARFASEVELYRSLPDSTASIAAALDRARSTIFAGK